MGRSSFELCLVARVLSPPVFGLRGSSISRLSLLAYETGAIAHPIVVEKVVGGGRRPRCLGCGACGPLRAGAEQAMLALRAEARHRQRKGA